MPMRRSSSDSPCEPVLSVAVAGLGQVRQFTLEQITLTQDTRSDYQECSVNICQASGPSPASLISCVNRKHNISRHS